MRTMRTFKFHVIYFIRRGLIIYYGRKEFEDYLVFFVVIGAWISSGAYT